MATLLGELPALRYSAIRSLRRIDDFYVKASVSSYRIVEAKREDKGELVYSSASRWEAKQRQLLFGCYGSLGVPSAVRYGSHDTRANAYDTARVDGNITVLGTTQTLGQSASDGYEVESLIQVMYETKCIDLDKWRRIVDTKGKTSNKVTVEDICYLLQSTKSTLQFSSVRKLSEVLYPLLIESTVHQLLSICQLYSDMKYLHEPVFTHIAKQLLHLIESGASLSSNQCLDVLRAFALQHYQHNAVLEALMSQLKRTKDTITAEAAVSIFYWLAELDMVDATVREFVLPIIVPHIKQLDLHTLSLLVHSFFLTNDEQDSMDIIRDAMECAAPLIFSLGIQHWQQSLEAAQLHRRLLVIRSYYRNIHKSDYDCLTAVTRSALRRIRDIEFNQVMTKETKFVKTFSWLLKELRIAHYTNLARGPFVYDIVERDSNIVWELNSYHKYYVGTLSLTASAKLQKRITQAMGFLVAQCPYWHWSKMKVKRTRYEYIRMSRYYALRDRRQFDQDFEGWTLPYIHSIHPDAKGIHHKDYFPPHKKVAEMETY